MERGTLLDVLGNETRREILRMLSEGPCYVSQIAQELAVGHKAVIEHLGIMRDAGILETRTQRVQKGRPRKYYRIQQDFTLEVRVSRRRYRVQTIIPRRELGTPPTSPALMKISRELEEVLRWGGKERELGLLEILTALRREEKRLLEERKVLQYLLERVYEGGKEEERGWGGIPL